MEGLARMLAMQYLIPKGPTTHITHATCEKYRTTLLGPMNSATPMTNPICYCPMETTAQRPGGGGSQGKVTRQEYHGRIGSVTFYPHACFAPALCGIQVEGHSSLVSMQASIHMEDTHVAQSDQIFFEHEGYPHHRQQGRARQRVNTIHCRDRTHTQQR